MSFFVKAVVKSLQEYPAVNAEIKDENIIYKNHFDIGIAVGTEKGLVVPILKDADQLSKVHFFSSLRLDRFHIFCQFLF